MYHAIFVSNVETGETKQITDGLADAVWPAWDASGKYLWFLASTDFGLQLSVARHDVVRSHENFGLYLAVLKKSDARPLLPESDEDRGVGTGAPAGGAVRSAGSAADAAATAGEAARTERLLPARPRAPVTVQIDFDGLPKRDSFGPGVPERQYSQLRAGVDGTVFYLEAGGGGRGGGGGGGSELMRYRLSDRRAATFAIGRRDVRSERRRSQAALSRRWRRRRRTRAARAGGTADRRSVHRRRRSQSAAAGGRARLTSRCACISTQGGVQTDLQRRLAQRARLSVRAQHARLRLAEDEGDVRPDAALRECIAPISTTCST